MPKLSLDPNKIDKIRDEIKNPETNAIAKLETIYHMASSIEFDGSKALVELLDKELYKGYATGKVPPYRKIPLEFKGVEGKFTYEFPDPLIRYNMYIAIDIMITPDNPLPAYDVISAIISELEQTTEMKSFFKFLYREGTRRQEEEHTPEAKPYKRDKVDFTGLNMKPIKLGGDK